MCWILSASFTHNDDLSDSAIKTGFYGLDLYSLHTSINAVLSYLQKIDPEGAERARRDGRVAALRA
ncbi:MAG TPA: erythromycin esterase family protein [Candidatus Paceibacterota bacterium]|nr:erythromycin esterase family protein [Candidatus Paceibacterota bacterium]